MGKIAGWIIKFFVACALFAVAVQWIDLTAQIPTAGRIALILALSAAVLVPAYRHSTGLGAMAPAERAAYDAGQKQYWERIWRSGLVRYASAALLVWFAVWIPQHDTRGVAWLIALAALVYALIRAREISILVLAVGGMCVIFKGVALLPVSVAVIIGAIIIADAMRR